MQTNSESCVYVEGDDEVYGVQELNDTSLFDEYSYYGAPQSPTFSGVYFFDNQEYCYDYGAYHYENYPVYYLYPTYLDYYPLTNLQYSPANFYHAYVYVPVNSYYYVPHFVYTTSTNNVNDISYEVDSIQSYESDVMSSSMEQSFDNSQEFNSNVYNMGNSSKEIIGEEQTTFHLDYEEYPEMLNEAPVDDKEKSECSNKKLEKDVVSDGAEVNECTAVDDESYSSETNLCEDDVDRKLIKKISSLSIDEVKEDIDENYENAKAFLYNEVLKGYIEIKNQLEELEWECHSLEDILEEEEPESDSSEVDFNENVAEDIKNINMLPDEEDCSCFESVTLSEESHEEDGSRVESVTLSEESHEEDGSRCESVTLSEESHEEDGSCFESVTLSEESHEEDGSRFESVTLSEESQVASNEKDLVDDYQIVMEVAQPSVDPLVVEEKDKTDPVLDLCLSKEDLHSGSLNSIEDHYPPADSTAIEEKCKTGPFVKQSLSKEQLHSGSLNSIEKHHPPVESSVAEENHMMDPVPQLSLREEELDSKSRSSMEEVHTKMSSQDRGEEILNSASDTLTPAALKTKQRKKRFSGLRKFFARMCCCVKKTS